MSQQRFLSVLAAFALVMGTLGAAVQPSFADDDDDEPNFMSKLLGSVGLLQLPGPHIDYRERPPLVVPPVTTYVQPQVPANSPSAQQSPWDFSNPRQQQAEAPEDNRPPLNNSLVLPPPVDPSAVQQRNPNFPVDPEIRAAQKKKKNTKRIFSRAEDDPVYSGRALTPAELRSVTAPRTKSASSGTDATANSAQSTAQQLGIPTINRLNIFSSQQEKPIEFTGEPERQSLTQPPSGYLTPSANAPYGIVGKDRRGGDTTRLVHPNMPDYVGPQTPR